MNSDGRRQPPPAKHRVGKIPRYLVIMFAALAVIAIVLGSYALHLKKRRVAREAQAAAEQAMTDRPLRESALQKPVTLYVANDSDGTLLQNASHRRPAGRAQ